MIKILKKGALLTLLLALTLCFVKPQTKAYGSEENSYIFVYINGVSKIKMSVYDFKNNVESYTNGWPTEWMVNEHTAGMTFDCATGGLDYDPNENQMSLGLLGDMIYYRLQNLKEGETTSFNVYLWFTSPGENERFATINYSYVKNDVVLDTANTKIVVSGDTYSFNYSELPNKIGDYDLSNGLWYYCYTEKIGSEKVPLEKLMNSSFSLELEGGKTYDFKYEYDAGTLVDPSDPYDDPEFWNLIDVPEEFRPAQTYIVLPKYFNDYYLQWSVDYKDSVFIDYDGYETDTLYCLERIQYPEKAFTMNLHARLYLNSNSEEILATHVYQILIHPEVISLDTPKLKYSTSGYSFRLYWNKVQSASSYGIYTRDAYSKGYKLMAKVGGDVTEYYLPGGLTEIGLYTLYVKAISTNKHYTDSDYSNGINYVYNVDYVQLSSPTLTLNGSVLSWEFIPNAGTYELYQDMTKIRTFNSSVNSFDLKTLNLKVGKYNFRLMAVPNDINKYSNSQYSAGIDFEQKNTEMVFKYNGKVVGSVSKSQLRGETLHDKEAFFNSIACPHHVHVDGLNGRVVGYYFDYTLVNLISKDMLFDYWHERDYEYLEIYLNLQFPLKYEGPTVIWKNPDSFLDVSEITKIIDSYCKTSTKDAYTLELVSDTYSGYGNKPGTYSITYKCTINDEETEIKMDIKVSSSIKVDYLHEVVFYVSKIASKEDIVFTCKTIGMLPNVDLAYSFLTYETTKKNDYYSKNAPYGYYTFLIDYESATGLSGFEQFEVVYFKDSVFQVYEKTKFPYGIVIVIVVGALFGFLVFSLSKSMKVRAINKRPKKTIKHGFKGKRYSKRRY